MNTAVIDEIVQQRIKKLDRWAWGLTIIVWLLVGMMRRYKLDIPYDLSFLAAANALFNTGVSIALLFALYYIRRGRILHHRNSIYVAMSLSAGFLVSYVAYHFTTEEIAFCRNGLERSVYYFILFSHIILAGLSLPFILLTFIRGYVGAYERHRRMSRWIYYVWLYVALSGPAVYLLLLSCR